MADVTHSTYYSPPSEPVEDETAQINALQAKFADGGWLATLVWNTRNAYLTWPDGTFPASQMRMIVEGFLAERTG